MSKLPASKERLRIVAYLQRRAVEGERVLKRNGQLRAAEARHWRRRVAALADEIEQGMHL
jgi:hypothetical protein